MDCAEECDGNPVCIEECAKAHPDTTVQRCTSTCEDHGLAIDPTTATMPCGGANPSVTFTVKGTGPFSWSATKGKLTIAADGKSAILSSINSGSAVAGVAYKMAGHKLHTTSCAIVETCCLSFGCNQQILSTVSGGGCADCGEGLGCGPMVCNPCPPVGNPDCDLCPQVEIKGAKKDVRSPSMIALGCNPCKLEFDSAVVRVADKRGNAVQATVTS